MSGALPGDFSRVGFVTGLAQEARIARRLGPLVAVGGGTRDGARAAAHRLADAGATALVSFGIAGGLDPALRPGALVMPRCVLVLGEPDVWIETDSALSGALAASLRARASAGAPQSPARRGLLRPLLRTGLAAMVDGTIVGAGALVVSAAQKRRLYEETGCAAVDLESGAVAEVAQARSLPFAVLRAIGDPAEAGLPPAARAGLSPRGGIAWLPVLASVLRQPRQVPALLRLGRQAAAARRALTRVARGPVRRRNPL